MEFASAEKDKAPYLRLIAGVAMKPNNNFEKCHGNGCAFKDQCYRNVRPAGTHQSWKPFDRHADDDCKFYEPIPRDCKSAYDQVERDEFERGQR